MMWRTWLLSSLMVIASCGGVSASDIGNRIIPWPKESRLLPGKPLTLHTFSLAIADDGRARIAAEEINERIRSLGADALPVLPLDRFAAVGDVIMITDATTLPSAVARSGVRITAKDPGPQGYVIRFQRTERGTRVVLAGSDSLGMLYATETLRQLIERRGQEVVLIPAEIRDWPDYLYRELGVPFSEPFRRGYYEMLAAERKGDLEAARRYAEQFVRAQKSRVDFMLRAKINMAWNSMSFQPGNAPEQTTVLRSALHQVHEYARQRGIVAMAADTTAIGHYPEDRDNPDFRDVAFHRSHKRYFCWSRLDYHRRRAKRAAQFLAESGYGAYYLHAADGGGWENPGLWNDRCEKCRRVYGDDHARADAAVFRVYYDEIKKRVPDIQFVAVVYPYSGRYLDPDYVYRQASASLGQGDAARKVAERTTTGLMNFLQRLNTLLPPDIFVTIRESERRYLDLARRAWGKRRFHLYYEYAYWKGGVPYFITTPLWTRSLYYPGYEDILFGNVSGRGWREVTQLLGVECAWNVNRPGAGDFNRDAWHTLGLQSKVPRERKTFAERACRFLFGPDAGPLMSPVFAENISYRFIAFPEEVLRYVEIENPAAVMERQAEACDRAARSLDRLYELQVRRHVLSEEAEKYFLSFYRMTHSARIVARHRAHWFAMKQAIPRGDRTTIRRESETDLAELRDAETEWQAVVAKTPPKRLLAPYMRRTAPPGFLANLDIAALRKETETLAATADQQIAAYSIPGWFSRGCRSREVVAVAAEKPIRVDGKLDEPVWQRAPRIEHFIDYRVLRLESLETVARLAYDAEHLYVAFDCVDPDPKGINTFLPGRDLHSLCDSVEVLIAPRRGATEFVHWIIDSRSTLFDGRQANDGSGAPKYSIGWNGNAVVKTRQEPGRWVVEMSIPRSDLGFFLRQGEQYAILLCRNIVHTTPGDQPEQTAILFLDGDGFHTVSKFATLRLGGKEEPTPPPQVDITLRPVLFRHETTGDGSGTRIGGGLSVETDTNLHDVQVSVKLTDGVRVLGEQSLGGAPLVELRWRPERPFSILLPTELPGVEAVFHVQSREGEWQFRRRFGSPKRGTRSSAEVFTTGVSGKSVRIPLFFPTAGFDLLKPEEGTVEFWLRLHHPVRTRFLGPRGPLEQTFFNFGPIRPDYPYLSNRDSLTIAQTNDGSLWCTIANAAYESRFVRAPMKDLQPGEWHHIALQWKLDDGGKTSMQLFIDGRLASDECVGSSRHPNDKPLTWRLLPFPVQLGAMNTGFRPADADLDELRISSGRRYRNTFVPPRCPEPDGNTLVLFHFDGDLRATVPGTLIAVPGPAQ